MNDFQTHVSELCQEHDITHYVEPISIFESRFQVDVEMPDERWHNFRIITPPVEDIQSYGVALHEIGHVARRKSCWLTYKAISQKEILDAETDAWEWALEESHEPLDEEFIAHCVETYILSAGAIAKKHPIQKLARIREAQ